MDTEKTDVQINQEELEHRLKICNRKLKNFVCGLVRDFGLVMAPVYTVQTTSSVIELPADIKWNLATNVDLDTAMKILDETDRRAKRRKARALREEAAPAIIGALTGK